MEAKAERPFFFFFLSPFSYSGFRTSMPNFGNIDLTFVASVDKVGDNAGESLQHATYNEPIEPIWAYNGAPLLTKQYKHVNLSQLYN